VCSLDMDTMVSMKMRRLTHLQGAKPKPYLPLASSNSGGSGSGYLNHTASNGAWRLLVVR
jgi:hypothetical protein